MVSSMFDFNSFICMVRIHTFWVVWIEYVGPTVASSFYYCPSCARPFHTLYDIFLSHRSPLYLLWLRSIVDYGSTLFICGHGSFRFDMVPFCILSNHDSFINYTYVGSTCIFMVMFCIWTCMSHRSVLSDIYLSFRYLCSSLLILDSLLSPYSIVSLIMYSYHLPL